MSEMTKDPLLQKIWRRRKILRLNQAEMAKRLGVKQRAYSAIESGENRMYADYLPEIARALGLSVGDLFEEVDPKIGPLNKEEKTFVSALREITSAKARKALEGIMEELAKTKDN